MDRERSDLEDRRIFVRTRLVNEIWLEDTLGDGDMEHQHGAVTKDHQQEQSTGHVEPAGRQQCHEHGIHDDQGHGHRDVGDAEDEGVLQGAGHGVLEACLKREHPFETDKPEDGQREFDDEQRRDLQDDP